MLSIRPVFQIDLQSTLACDRRLQVPTFVTPVMRLVMCDVVVRITASDLRLPKWQSTRSIFWPSSSKMEKSSAVCLKSRVSWPAVTEDKVCAKSLRAGCKFTVVCCSDDTSAAPIFCAGSDCYPSLYVTAGCPPSVLGRSQVVYTGAPGATALG